MNTGKLRDILMMDAVPTSVGVMVWLNSDSGSSNYSSSSSSSSNTLIALDELPVDRCFHVVLAKGSYLPAKGVRTYKVASKQQKFISVDVFEEIEVCSDTYSN